MKLYRVHYHEHAEICPQCAVASDLADPSEPVSKVLLEIYNHSCEDGKNILMQFWLSYKDEEEWIT